jgi:tetratricopeptide (TPR) repeat protein
MPLLMLWMAWTGWRSGTLRRRLLGAVLCLSITLLTIAPWTIRNWLAYGYFIPVETGLSFNLWVFNEPREDIDTIFRTLESITNPGKRAEYATAKGIARLREDPSILLRRIETNWFYLWHIKPIEDRFLQESYYQDVPGDLFVLALLLDDGLYILIVASALAGMLLVPRRAFKLLAVGWLVSMIGVMLLTHSEGRYRQFLFPVLIPLATACWSAGCWQRATPGRRMAAVGLGLCALIPLTSYPVAWASTNLERAWFEALGDRAMRRGDYRAAQAAYRRGVESDPLSADILMKAGLAYDRAGDLDNATQAYVEAAAIQPGYIAATARLGDAFRRAGQDDLARSTFQGFYTDPIKISDWAWKHLEAPAESLLEVGDGLDAGFIFGMYKSETIDGRGVRWTSEQSKLRLANYETGARIRLRLAAPRPDGRPVTAQICVDGGACQIIEAGTQWRTIDLLAPRQCTEPSQCGPGKPPAAIEVTFSAPTFSPANTVFAAAQSEPEAVDTRHLGLLLDYAVSMPLGEEKNAGPDEEAK